MLPVARNASSKPPRTCANPEKSSASPRSLLPLMQPPRQDRNVFIPLVIRIQRATHKSVNGNNFATPPSTINTATAIFTMRLHSNVSPHLSLTGRSHSQDIREVHGGRVGEVWEPQRDDWGGEMMGRKDTWSFGRVVLRRDDRSLDGWA